MSQAYIGLGSNLDRPCRQLQCAVRALARLPRSKLESVSNAYFSAAVGPIAQPKYLNAVARLSTTLAPQVLLSSLQRIERQHGRRRTVRWGPRPLDLDLLIYGDKTMNSYSLTLPHPRMTTRDWVLYPLREIGDTSVVSADGQNLDELLAQAPSSNLQRATCRLRRAWDQNAFRNHTQSH